LRPIFHALYSHASILSINFKIRLAVDLCLQAFCEAAVIQFHIHCLHYTNLPYFHISQMLIILIVSVASKQATGKATSRYSRDASCITFGNTRATSYQCLLSKCTLLWHRGLLCMSRVFNHEGHYFRLARHLPEDLNIPALLQVSLLHIFVKATELVGC